MISEIIARRRTSQSKPGHRSDGVHLALVVEAGGMRGVVAGGALHVLAEAGGPDCFDSIYGSSAGACAAAFFLAGQTDAGRKVYHVDICNRRAVNPWRVFSRPCMVDTDFIVDEIMAKKRALDCEKIVATGGMLNIFTTAADDGSAIIHRDFVGPEAVLTALKASLRVPGPREPGIEIGGRRHIDGDLATPFPIVEAMRGGATHVLAVGTRRECDYESPSTTAGIEASVLSGLYGSGVGKAYRAARSVAGPFNRDEAAVRGAHVELIARPRGSVLCEWHTIDTATLAAAEREAIAAAQRFLAGRSN